MEAGGILSSYSCSMIADTADETAALDHDVHRLRHHEFYAATEGVDLDLLILRDGGFAQVHTDTATEGVEAGAVERLATVDIFVASIVHATTDALAVLTNGQRTLQPLVRVATITVDNKAHSYIYQQTDAEIGNPRLLRYCCKPTPLDKPPDCCQFC